MLGGIDELDTGEDQLANHGKELHVKSTIVQMQSPDPDFHSDSPNV